MVNQRDFFRSKLRRVLDGRVDPVREINGNWFDSNIDFFRIDPPDEKIILVLVPFSNRGQPRGFLRVGVRQRLRRVGQ